MLTKFEHRGQPPLPRPAFLARLARHAAVAAGLLAAALLLGMAGYHLFEKLSWIDAFLNAAMLLGGMGPVDAPKAAAGKLFAGAYALFAGLVFITVAGVLAAPMAHRLLHRFHWREDDGDGGQEKPGSRLVGGRKKGGATGG